MLTRPLILIPTFNEQENVERLCQGIQQLDLALDLLFVDDNSTDGTGLTLDRLADRHANVRVLHRPGKLGIGSAHRAGITWAYDHGFAQLVTMDCDFTHDPRHIPELLALTGSGADVAVGSRYLRKDSLKDWNLYRKSLTKMGHFATRFVLGMNYDATNAYRCYHLRSIPRRLFDLVESSGYSFFFESLYVLHRNGFRIEEIPIALPSRTYGHSKMDPREIRHSLRLLASTYFKAVFNPEKFKLGRAVALEPPSRVLRDEQGWEQYWRNHKTIGGLVYDAVAAFYRKFVIRRSLNHFVHAHFAPGARVLHAGCGSGQVDVDVRRRVAITALDISPNALDLYCRVNGHHCRVLHGSVLDIPLPDGSMQGVYNLGVMEHFTEDEIRRILREFHRVLESQGRVLVFWPPEFGLSVLFFKALGFVVRTLLRRRNAKFHPDEITRIRSRAHVTRLFEESGFAVVQYYFGPLDLFTYVVVAAERVATPRTGAVSDAILVAAS